MYVFEDSLLSFLVSEMAGDCNGDQLQRLCSFNPFLKQRRAAIQWNASSAAAEEYFPAATNYNNHQNRGVPLWVRKGRRNIVLFVVGSITTPRNYYYCTLWIHSFNSLPASSTKATLLLLLLLLMFCASQDVGQWRITRVGTIIVILCRLNWIYRIRRLLRWKDILFLINDMFLFFLDCVRKRDGTAEQKCGNVTWQGGDDDILCACPGLAAYKASPLSINNKLFPSSSAFQESSGTVVSVIFGGFWAINLQIIAAEYYKGPSDRRGSPLASTACFVYGY